MNRIVELPIGLKPTADIYVAALTQRNQASDTQARLYLSKNFAFNGDPADSYLQLARMSRFAWYGVLTADFLAAAAKTAVVNTLPVLPPEVPASSPFPLVAGLAIQLDGPDLILDEVTDFDSLAGALLVFVDDEIMSISVADLTGAGAYTLTIVRGFFGTTIADHAAGTDVHIIRRADMIPVTHPSFQTGNIIQLKLAIGVENVSDITPFGFEVGGASNAPLISSLDTLSVPHGSVGAVTTLFGAGFTNNPTDYITIGSLAPIYMGDSPGSATTFVDSTQIVINNWVPVTLGLSAGATVPVTFTNASGTSNAVLITLT